MQETLDKPMGIHVRLAETPEEVESAQRLRYKVFYEEWGAKPTPAMIAEKREIEPFDSVMDHLIVVDPARGKGHDAIVGTYRLLRDEVAKKHGKFYTSQEFNIQPFIDSGATLLELGRSCVLPEYRTMPVLQLLWQGIAKYLADHKIEMMFGCASFRGTDVESVSEALSYLHHFHLAPENLRSRALDHVYVNMDRMPRDQIDPRRALLQMEPLIKGYLRVGAMIGDGAYVDEQFNSIDVCIVMPVHLLTAKYLKHYERTTQRTIVSNPEGFSGEYRDQTAADPALTTATT